jgi:hypothetical protein
VNFAEFDRVVTHADDAVGIQISQPIGKLVVHRCIENFGGTGPSLVKGVVINLSAIALSISSSRPFHMLAFHSNRRPPNSRFWLSTTAATEVGCALGRLPIIQRNRAPIKAGRLATKGRHSENGLPFETRQALTRFLASWRWLSKDMKSRHS